MKDVADQGSGGALLVEGIVAGTRIATARGWRCVETLRPGDAVRTIGGGVQPLTEARPARLSRLPLPPVLWPLSVPMGALDCREPLLLLPGQRLLVELDGVAASMDDPFALVPAAALEGWRGIARQSPAPGLAAMTLGFAAPQLIYASRATLLACPGQAGMGAFAAADLPMLSLAQARHLVTCLIAQDLGRVLRRREA